MIRKADDSERQPNETSLELADGPISSTNDNKSVRFHINGTQDELSIIPETEEINPSTTQNERENMRASLMLNFGKSRSRLDLSTGMENARQQSIRIVHHDSTEPKSRLEKVIQFCNKMVTSSASSGSANEEGRTENGEFCSIKVKHYRVKSHEDRKDWINRIAGHPANSSSHISEFLRWCFRAPFVEVGLVAYLFFSALIVVFAIFIYWAGRFQPVCILAGNSDFEEAGTDFMDAIQLSWTTLATVGYGVVAPRTPGYITANPQKSPFNTRCFGINFLMALESFVGVIFASVASAVIFGKIARVQSMAHVRFSDPILIRYGLGAAQACPEVDEEDNDDGMEPVTLAAKQDDRQIPLPCPILEFRLVNSSWNLKGGEIMDASLNVVAVTYATDDSIMGDSIRPPSSTSRSSSAKDEAVTTRSIHALTSGVKKLGAVSKIAASSGGAALLGAGKIASNTTGTILQKLNRTIAGTGHSFEGEEKHEAKKPYNSALEETKLQEQVAAQLKELASKVEGSLKSSITVDEGDNKLSPRRTFFKLDVDTDAHPFFKRVWHIRHILNENSPLLSLEARRAIRSNGGAWPKEWDHHSFIREHVHFHEIIVNFSGTANVSGSSVYAQCLYSYNDVCVGYTFAQMLGRSMEGKLVVDGSLLNDVREQNGGGGEPLDGVDDISLLNAARTAVDAAADQAVHARQAAKDMVLDTAHALINQVTERNTTVPGQFPEDTLGTGEDMESGPSADLKP